MIDTVTLPNGVKIVMEKNPYIRSISFGIWVRNGSRNEQESENGISHFIEHMCFKGTENRSAKEIADQMDAIGGQLNAYTSKECTVFFTRVLDSHFDIALDILADMFFNSKFDDGEIEKEKNVIYEEISMYEDTPEDLVHEILQSGVWKNDPLGYPILGTKETLSKFNNKIMTDYVEKAYSPENTVISVVGNFEKDNVVKKIEKYFKSFERKKPYIEPKFKTKYHSSIITREKDIEQLHLCLTFPGIALGDDLTYDLSVLNTLFGGGMSSKLFQSVREDKGLVYSIYSYASSYIGAGIVTIYSALNPSQCQEALTLTIDEIKNIKSTKIDDITLKNTKEQIKSNYMLGLESSSNRMTNIGRSELMMGRILTEDEILSRIDAVTTEKIYDLCNKIFDFSQISVSAVGDISDLDFERMIKDETK